MSLYYSNFKYLDKNSLEEGLIVAAFEPDDGFMDSFLSMEPIQEDYYDGTKKFDYGAKYNSSYIVNISVVKSNGSDFSLSDVRRISRWLTGSRINSWLDVGPAVGNTKYSFLGRVTNLQPRKMDGRTVGFLIEFSSITPWAYSEEQFFERSIEQVMNVDDNGVLISNEMSVDEDGVLCNGATPGPGANFLIDEYGVIYVTTEKVIYSDIYNETDDLYSYTYLDIEFINDTCGYLEIRNETLGETTRVNNLRPNDIINITNKQFIMAYTVNQVTGELVNQNRIFGDDFNFVWPRLAPGDNKLIIEGGGNGTAKFTYRYPMKVGDCAMDIVTYGGDTICDCPDNTPFEGIIKWQDIIGTPSTLAGYGITNAYTKTETDEKIDDIDVDCSCDVNTTIDETELNKMLNDLLV